MSELASLTCVPCRGGVPALKGKDLEAMKRKLPGWEVVNEHHLHKAFTFPDFVKALALVNRVGDLAEQQGHHPDILLTWGKVEITIWTHKIDGLSESDFIMAAKIRAPSGDPCRPSSLHMDHMMMLGWLRSRWIIEARSDRLEYEVPRGVWSE